MSRSSGGVHQVVVALDPSDHGDNLARSACGAVPMSEPLVALCALSSLREDEGISVELPDRRAVAVFLHNGQIHVVDDLCTHGTASLAEGICESGEIECPFHLGRFCLLTGAPTHPPCVEPIAVYETRIVDGIVYLAGAKPRSGHAPES